MALHLEMALIAAFLPLGSRGEVQACRFIRLATDIPRTHDSVAVGDGKIEQTAGLHAGDVMPLRDVADELIDLGDGLDHHTPQQGLAEPLRARIGAGVHTLLLEEVEEERERPLAVGAALHAQEPLVGEGIGQRALDVVPPADVAVVHPHQRLVLERVAVIVGERAFCRGAHVGKDQVGARLRRETLQVLAVPRWQCGGEDARLRTQLGVCVEADTEAIAVDWAAVVLRLPWLVWVRAPGCDVDVPVLDESRMIESEWSDLAP